MKRPPISGTPPARLLLTGFEPFDGSPVNPSWQVAQALDGAVIAGHQVHAALLPCAFGQALDVLDRALERTRPALVLALGQAASRRELSMERVAINIDDARIPDNRGAQPIDEPVVPEAAAAYFTNLPVKTMVAAAQAAGVPAAVSQTAGTFVCNHVFYGLMHRLASRPGVRGGFIHVPLLPEQALAGAAGMPLADMVRGVRAALDAALGQTRDDRLVGGRED
jgi:pyroglutamyl-peptidase